MTTVTDANGNYNFFVPPGSYVIQFIPPAGSTLSPSLAGAPGLDSDVDPASGLTTPVTVAAGEALETVDGGAIPAVGGFFGTIGDTVWQDNNSNGIQDPGEPGIPGVVVTLLDFAGNPILDVFGNPVTTVTDANGNYIFFVPPGDYIVEFTPPPGLSLTTPFAGGTGADSNADPLSGRSDVISVNSGDVITDIDAGVIPESGLLQVMWNGFCDQQNFLSLVNTCEGEAFVAVELFGMAGTSLGSDGFTVPGFGNIDFAINDMPGFSEFDFGILNALATPTGCLAGDMGLFAPIGDGQFFSTELSMRNLGGESQLFSLSDGSSSNACYAAFNTFNPSLNPEDSNLPVTHWLQLANLETESKETFTVNRYDSTGALIFNQQITLDPGGRTDIAAGHEDAVMNRYGLIQVIPENAGIEYTAQIFRYGVDQLSLELEHLSSFNMAENCSTGSGASQYVSVSNGANANNWLELQNLSNVTETVNVRLYSNSSGEKSSRSFELEPYSSLHVNAVEGFSPGESGIAEVRPVNGMPILVTSTSYLYEADGRVKTAFSSTGRALLGSSAVSSFNTFRNQLNWLRVYNVRNGEVSAKINALSQQGEVIGSYNFTLGSKAGVDINLAEALSLTAGAQIGQLQFQISRPGALFAEIARVEHNADYTRIIEIETFGVR